MIGWFLSICQQSSARGCKSKLCILFFQTGECPGKLCVNDRSEEPWRKYSNFVCLLKERQLWFSVKTITTLPYLVCGVSTTKLILCTFVEVVIMLSAIFIFTHSLSHWLSANDKLKVFLTDAGDLVGAECEWQFFWGLRSASRRFLRECPLSQHSKFDLLPTELLYCLCISYFLPQALQILSNSQNFRFSAHFNTQFAVIIRAFFFCFSSSLAFSLSLPCHAFCPCDFILVFNYFWHFHALWHDSCQVADWGWCVESPVSG